MKPSTINHQPSTKSYVCRLISLTIFISLIFLGGCTKSVELEKNQNLEIQESKPSFSFKINRNTNTLEFTDFNDYRNYLATEEKKSFFDTIFFLKFRSLHDQVVLGNKRKKMILNNWEGQPEKLWFEDEDLINFTRILNPDGIFSVNDYYFKISEDANFVYISTKSSIVSDKSIYSLLNEEIETQGKVFKVSTSFDIIDMLEEAGLPDSGIEQQSIFCWGRGGADGDRIEPAVYFLDETWPASIISFSANNPYGEPSSNSRVSVKLEYIRLGVFFQLVLKGKYDREDGGVNINGDNIFGGTSAWGTGEGNWNITFSEKHQGKCRRDNEVFNSGTISPPLNNENKARRVFWERDNGLHKYQLIATLNLNLKRAWRGIETETYHYVSSNEFFSIPTPRMVNSTEIFNFQTFQISDNY